MNTPTTQHLRQPPHDFGGAYLSRGWHCMWQPGLRRYSLIPMCLNLLLFGAGSWWAAAQLAHWIQQLLGYLPSYLQWLEWLLWPLLILALISTFALLFTTVATLLAAPFNSLLAEQVLVRFGGLPAAPVTITRLLRELPAVLLRELQKLAYLLPRLLCFFVLLWLLPVAGQVLWVLFGAWMLAVQYADYSFDQQHIPFRAMLRQLGAKRSKAIGFGLVVGILSSLPLLHLLLMPAAVCGASLMYLDHFQQHGYNSSTLPRQTATAPKR